MSTKTKIQRAILDANRVALEYFSRTLLSNEGRPARAYCASRGIRRPLAERFHLGYAPDRWDGLVTELQRRNIPLDIAREAALVRDGKHGPYDFYRNRLIIPILSATGDVVAFGGRAITNDVEPKYINTATTPLYTKGRHLFGLDIAKKSAAICNELIVVEGYLDCISLHAAGIDNAVAALGTAFTPEQGEELKAHADRYVLCFDADAAGRSAAVKAIDVLAKTIPNAGTRAFVSTLPENEDPDSIVRTQGVGAFRELLTSARPAIALRLDVEAERATKTHAGTRLDAHIRNLTPRSDWDAWRLYAGQRIGTPSCS